MNKWAKRVNKKNNFIIVNLFTNELRSTEEEKMKKGYEMQKWKERQKF